MHAAAAQDEVREIHRRLRRMLTAHASERMRTRRLSSVAVAAAIAYGRLVHTRGADIYAIGQKEALELARDGIDLFRFRGVQVVCSPDGRILTVYREHNFRTLRPGNRRRRTGRRCRRLAQAV
ncbi:MAG: DUF4258 domain-containing protein [Myxococcales bacterium]|nr:DUF4258 domain-containing protein [Myxococcota bacterium]MDW8281542.1 DUF4258 domain-containing protein [Myxococcales bacterium]